MGAIIYIIVIDEVDGIGIAIGVMVLGL